MQIRRSGLCGEEERRREKKREEERRREKEEKEKLEKERLGRRDRLLRLLALAFFKFEKQRMVSKGASVTLKTSALVQRSTRRALPKKSKY